MDWQLFGTVFGSVFVAELGDKTQLATMSFALKPGTSKWHIFAAAAAALVLTSAIGVVAGQWLGTWISERVLKWVAGLGFIAIGLWTLLRA
jgi:putative Ca2+/H+ antiporter (TMEM165/GDT1 family)